MDFSKLKLNEDALARENEVAAADKAAAGGQKQIDNTIRRKQSQKSQMATQGGQNSKSDVSFASESYLTLRTRKEIIKMREGSVVDWRKELREEDNVQVEPTEASQAEEGKVEDEEDMHPYVEVMPSTNFKQQELIKQMKAAKEAAPGLHMAAQAGVQEQVMSEDKASDAREERRKRPGEKNIKDVMHRINKEALPKHMAHQEWLDSLKIHGQKKDVKEGFKEDEIEELRRQHKAREEQKKKLPKYKSAPQSRPSPYGRKKGDPYAPRGGESD